jgi:transposase
MNFTDLIIEAMGLQDILLESYSIDKSALKLDLFAKQKREKCKCITCGTKLLNVHDWRVRHIRAPSFGAFTEVWVHLKRLRAVCDICDGQLCMSPIKGLHPQFENMTLALTEKAGRLMEEITCEATARLLRLNPKTMWDLDQWRMRRMYKDLQLPDNLDLSMMSADEIHFRTIENDLRENPFSERWVVKYVTNLVCTTASKIIANSDGRDAMALANCLKILPKEKRREIKFFALDMNPGFFRAVTKLCPSAEIAVDRFHLVQSLNETFNEVRKEEFKRAQRRKDSFQEGMLEPGRRFILMERNPTLSTEEANMLGKLRILNVNINAGMLIVDYFHKVLDQPTLAKFRKRLKQWYKIVREAKLKQFTKFALLVSKYRRNIEAYIKSDLTTAISEGINNKIKVLKRMAYGYTNPESFRLKILQRCGFLNSNFIDTSLWHWHIPHHQ